MLILPAIDLYGGCAVRLYKGDYDRMTVYSHTPRNIALDFAALGADYMHVVDLEGAKDGTTPNLSVIATLLGLGVQVEVGGGIRSIQTVERYLSMGVDRVILGTAAVEDPAFLARALGKYGPRIAVGVDIRDGLVAVKGWTEATLDAGEFLEKLEGDGVSTVIVTDISKDGAMQGANTELYRTVSSQRRLQLVASGGVSSMEDVKRLRDMGLYGAIVGKAYYEGKLDLASAIKEAAL